MSQKYQIEYKFSPPNEAPSWSCWTRSRPLNKGEVLDTLVGILRHIENTFPPERISGGFHYRVVPIEEPLRFRKVLSLPCSDQFVEGLGDTMAEAGMEAHRKALLKWPDATYLVESPTTAVPQ